jgi:predicted kinase
VPRLVHLNGPPGIGKSTLARRYVNEHSLAFCLDIDGFRSLIGHWDEHEPESGTLARRMALAMAREHLSSGHDVVIPQLVTRPAFAEQLREVAIAAGATFHELVLLDAADAAIARFEARTDDPVWSAHHREATRMIAAAGGFSAVFDALVSAIPSLPGAVEILTRNGDVDAAYGSILAAVGEC